MKNYLEKHHRPLGIIGALIALAVAVIYFVIVPEEVSSATGVQKAILAYGHSLCWILLSGASIAWSVSRRSKWIKFFAYGALAVYVVFVGTLLITRMSA